MFSGAKVRLPAEMTPKAKALNAPKAHIFDTNQCCVRQQTAKSYAETSRPNRETCKPAIGRTAPFGTKMPHADISQACLPVGETAWFEPPASMTQHAIRAVAAIAHTAA